MKYGHPRTLTFHLTGAAAGGSADREIRVSQRLDRIAIIRSVELIPAGSVAVGQYVDVLIAQDDDLTDTAAPTGYSIFEGPQGFSDLPTEDQSIGIPVAAQPYDVPMAYEIPEAGRTIKVVSNFVAPAVAPAAVHVVIVLEEFDTYSTPIDPRPPLVPAPPPPPPTPTPEQPAPTPAPVPPYTPPPTRNYCGTQRYAFGDVCPLPQPLPLINLSGVECLPCVSDELNRYGSRLYSR